MTTAKSARRRGLYSYPKKIGKIIEKWYYFNDSDNKNIGKVLYPTIGSGSFGKKRPDLKAQKGDLCPIDKWVQVKPWVLCLELKHRKEWSFEQLIQSPEDNYLLDYWKQVYEDATVKVKGLKGRQYKYFPLLIFTTLYGKDYCMFDADRFNASSFAGSIYYHVLGTTLGITTLTKFIQNTSVDSIIADVTAKRRSLKELKKGTKNGN
jgi:hypothetical protein